MLHGPQYMQFGPQQRRNKCVVSISFSVTSCVSLKFILLSPVQ